MTQDEIIRMAREAGLANSGCTCNDCMPHIHKLERFAALVAARKADIAMAEAYRCGYEAGQLAENEACAKVCEDDMGWLDNGGGELCAAAIRARKS